MTSDTGPDEHVEASRLDGVRELDWALSIFQASAILVFSVLLNGLQATGEGSGTPETTRVTALPG